MLNIYIPFFCGQSHTTQPGVPGQAGTQQKLQRDRTLLKRRSTSIFVGENKERYGKREIGVTRYRCSARQFILQRQNFAGIFFLVLVFPFDRLTSVVTGRPNRKQQMLSSFQYIIIHISSAPPCSKCGTQNSRTIPEDLCTVKMIMNAR